MGGADIYANSIFSQQNFLNEGEISYFLD